MAGSPGPLSCAWLTLQGSGLASPERDRHISTILPPFNSLLCNAKASDLERRRWKFRAHTGSPMEVGKRALCMQIWEDGSSPLGGQSSPGQGPWISLAQLGQPSGLGLMPWLQIWELSAELAAAGREAPSGWSSFVGTWAWLESVGVATVDVSLGVSPRLFPSLSVVLSDEAAASAW